MNHTRFARHVKTLLTLLQSFHVVIMFVGMIR